MRKHYFYHIVPKPFYWRHLERLCKEYRVNGELLADFLKDLYNHVCVDMMSYEEISSYDDYEKDSYLTSLCDALVDEYKEDPSNDYDYADYYSDFITQVLWAKWFSRLVLTVNEEIETKRGIADSIEIRKRNIEIRYLEK